MDQKLINDEATFRIDPYWDSYFRWPANYFPFNLPACSVTLSQIDLENKEETQITWKMDYNLELECSIVTQNKVILYELQPRNGLKGGHFKENYQLNSAEFGDKIGLTFTWAFYIPMPFYMPKHPMGLIFINSSFLKGKNTIITIKDTRKGEN